jgi:predicted Fe-Mo cluster-binding NifX family protein
MRIAIIGREGRVLPQCDGIAQIAIVDVDPGSHLVQQTAFLTPPAPKDAMADWLGEQTVQVVLTSGICRHDRDRLQQRGIRVIAGVPLFRFEAAIARFLSGTLQTGDNACEQRAAGVTS